MNRINQPLQAFLVAVQFLTILPVRFKRYPSQYVQAASLLYYPLVGLGIGAVLALLLQLNLTSSAPLMAAMLLAIWVMITGGLHLDGLADSSDALMGGLGDRAKSLRIMKDSCIGATGAIVLILYLFLMGAALIVVVDHQLRLPLMIAPVLARTAAIGVLATTPYVRDKGIVAHMIPHMPIKPLQWLVVGVCIISVVLAPFITLAVLLVVYLARRAMLTRLGGTTGDTAGALIAMVELTVITVAAFSV